MGVCRIVMKAAWTEMFELGHVLSLMVLEHIGATHTNRNRERLLLYSRLPAQGAQARCFEASVSSFS